VAKQQQRNARGAPPETRPTKAERREMARRQRQELRRKMERARRNRRIASWAIVALAIAGGVWLFTSGDDAPERRGPLPGVLTGPAPWSNNTEQLGARLDRLDLPPGGNALHIHSHLALFVDGEPVAVPADIGLSQTEHSPLHSHDETGVVHIESANAGSIFTLGEYLDVWGVRLSDSCLGGYCADGERTLHVFVDREPFAGDPRAIELSDRQLITIAFGTEADVPDPLPTYDWSQLQA
jgi:hypothetical protein